MRCGKSKITKDPHPKPSPASGRGDVRCGKSGITKEVAVIRLMMLIAISCMLQSCASAVNSRHLEEGKQDFGAGNFKQAFHELLPVAANGDAHAQYAVGYMYYYGYGATQDSESGRFWMQKSADQHYGPAVRALQMLK